MALQYFAVVTKLAGSYSALSLNICATQGNTNF